MDFMGSALVDIKDEFEDINEDSPELNKFEFVSTGEVNSPDAHAKQETDIELESGEAGRVVEVIKIEIVGDDVNSKDDNETAVNKPKGKPVKCESCGLMCHNSVRYKHHLMDHTGPPFKCHKCNKAYKKAAELTDHEKTHTGVHHIHCGTCGMRTHSKEKPFVCPLCNKGLSHSSSLKQHVAMPGEDFPFECDQCDKKFKTKTALVHHKHNHEGDREKGFQFANCPRVIVIVADRPGPSQGPPPFEKPGPIGVCKNPPGKLVDGGQRLLSYNVYTSFKNKGMSKSKSVKMTAEAVGISQTTVWKIVGDMESTGVIRSPPRTRKRSTLFDTLDEEQKNTLREIVNSFFLRKELPTINQIKQAAENAGILPSIGRTSFWRILQEMGFVWKKKGRHHMLVEEPKIVSRTLPHKIGEIASNVS